MQDSQSLSLLILIKVSLQFNYIIDKVNGMAEELEPHILRKF